MKILNLYAGIGGNRKLWGQEHSVTAVELNPQIAKIYQDFFPKDLVIVEDAISFFERNFHLYDFIWASPPCQSHTCMNRINIARRYNGESGMTVHIPDFRLYSLINFLDTYFRGNWVVENTRSDYEPLKKPQTVGRHWVWSNKIIPDIPVKKSFHTMDKHLTLEKLCELHEYPYEYFKNLKLDTEIKQILRNCVDPNIGLHILNSARKENQDLFTIKKEK